MELRGKYVLIAEGARGSLAKQLIAQFGLDDGREPQKYGIGLKELWQVEPEKHQPGLVQHSFGWPLDNTTGGGSFLYHFEDNLVAVGFVVHLNYKNPYLSPFEEFQRFKTHPLIAPTLRGRQAHLLWRARDHRGRLAVGAEARLPRRRADRLLGRLRQRAAHQGQPQRDALRHAGRRARRRRRSPPAGRTTTLAAYEAAWRDSEIGRDLKRVRNVKPLWSKFGTLVGVALGGLDMWTNELFGFSLFGTLKHGKPDYASLKPAADAKPIAYPKPDGVLTFDKLSSVFLSNTNHEEDQPVHLR